MTDARVQEEAQAAGMSVHDMRKRPIWLTENGQALHATSELEQIGDLAQSATKRMKRTVRRQKMMYAKRVFSKAHENFDVPHWRPQSVTLKGDPRYELQGAMMPDDPESWQRFTRVRYTPQLTEAATLEEWQSRAMVRPKPSASHAGSSTDGWIVRGTLPKSRTSPYFVMATQNKAGPPVNPIHFQHDQDETLSLIHI